MVIFRSQINPKCKWVLTRFSVIRPGGVFRADEKFWIKLNSYTAKKYYGHYHFGEEVAFDLTENVITFASQTSFTSASSLDQDNPYLIKKVQTQIQQPSQ